MSTPPSYEPPHWFSIEDYKEYMDGLQQTGWFSALLYRSQSMEEWQEGVDVAPESYFEGFLSGRFPPSHRRTAVVELPQDHDPVFSTGLEIRLHIDWSQSDELIVEGFKRVLAAKRQHFKPAFRRQQKGPLNAGPESRIKSWCNYQILAVFDIDFWHRVRSTKKPTAHQIHDLLRPGLDRDAKVKWGKRARRKLRDALSNDAPSDFMGLI